jgi:hypothetical protein
MQIPLTIPSILFALLIALALGALYHFVRGGGPGHLLAYLVASVLGFAAGNLVGIWRGWMLFKFGPIDFGLGMVGALACLVLADYLLHLPPKATEE